MSTDNLATTDTVALLPLLACCIAATMLVFTTISAAGGALADAQSQNVLKRTSERLLEEALYKITERGGDGLRYIVPEWCERSSDLLEDVWFPAGVGVVLVVNIMKIGITRMVMTGEIAESSRTYSSTAFAIYVDGEQRLPSIIGINVGT